jgi:hypothetical protein
VRVRLSQKGCDGSQQSGDGQGRAPRRPLCKNVEADLARAVDVAVVYARAEEEARRFERVVRRELYCQKKYACIPSPKSVYKRHVWSVFWN